MINFKYAVSALALVVGSSAGGALAQDYPSQPIHVVVPFAAGGGGDFVTRAWSDKMSEALGQPIVVENRPGGSTIVGTEYVASAEADGYTYLVVNPNFVTNRYMNETPYDAAEDFKPVGLFVTYPMGLAVRDDLEAETVSELISYAQENPGTLNYGSSGQGSTSHLASLLFLDQTGIEMQHVPYNGAGPAIADLAAGTIDMFFTGLSQSVPHVESGRVRLLAVSSADRIESYPDLPAISEEAGDGYEALVWWGIVAPDGTPDEHIETFQAALAEVMTDPEVQERYEVLDGDTTVTNPTEFSQFIDNEATKWSRIIDAAGL
ncbi:Bug family tripartite tricarboxylate transporter substrate binding protein [Pelagibacterium sp.]|uniref:Bug family tripartite tricarboxylate transporter substrate binding protein n=1 Tax=Pelagibacterium sp. TaxID=1967288 RepID=UPI003A9041CB